MENWMNYRRIKWVGIESVPGKRIDKILREIG